MPIVEHAARLELKDAAAVADMVEHRHLERHVVAVVAQGKDFVAEAHLDRRLQVVLAHGID